MRTKIPATVTGPPGLYESLSPIGKSLSRRESEIKEREGEDREREGGFDGRGADLFDSSRCLRRSLCLPGGGVKYSGGGVGETGLRSAAGGAGRERRKESSW